MDLLLILSIPSIITQVLFFIVAVAAVVGAVMAASTRPDAFDAGNRQPKHIWALLLGVSAIVMLFGGAIPILPWVAAVLTGLYWFDVRPQLRDIINGNYGY